MYFFKNYISGHLYAYALQHGKFAFNQQIYYMLLFWMLKSFVLLTNLTVKILSKTFSIDNILIFNWVI